MRTIPESIAAHNADSSAEDVVIVLTTWPDDTQGAVVARQLVEARLAACVTRLPRHQVTYRWQGAIEEAEEHQWVIKTSRAALERLREAVHAAHPYETPEWLVLRVEQGSAPYVQWVRDCTSTI